MAMQRNYNDLYDEYGINKPIVKRGGMRTGPWNPAPVGGIGNGGSINPAPANIPQTAPPRIVPELGPYNSPQTQTTAPGIAPELAGLVERVSNRRAPEFAVLEKASKMGAPELAGLKKASNVNMGGGAGNYADLFKQYMVGAAKPLENTNFGLSPEQMQGQINMMRGNMLGSNRALQQQAGEAMGGRGFLPGESGRTDTALAKIAQGGQAELAGGITNLLNEEAKRREGLGLRAEDINTQRLLAGSQYGNLLNQYILGKGGLGIQNRGLGLEREKFGYNKEQDALKMLLGLYQNEEGQQAERYNPYWQAQLRYGS